MAKEKAQSKAVKAPQTTQKVKTNKLELLVTIVPREKYESYQDLIQSFEVNMQLAVRGTGTANAEMLSLLGLENSQKAVIFSVIKEERVQEVLIALENRFKTVKKGKGIAYTIPFTSIVGVAIFGFLSNNVKTIKEE